MNSSVKYVETPPHVGDKDAAGHAIAAGDAASARMSPQHELALWLCALQSFFDLRHHPFTDVERTEIWAHDFAAELRIVRELLLRISQLINRLDTVNPAETSPSLDTHSISFDAGGEQANDIHTPDARETLAEVIGDALTLCQTLTDGRTVAFDVWSSFGNYLREHVDSPTVRFSSGHSRREDAKFKSLLDELADRATPEALAVDLRKIFSGLAGLLARLTIVEHFLREDRPLKQALPVFTLVHEETRNLLEFMETRALKIEGLDEPVFDALDGTAYAIRMELRKSFEHELNGVSALRHAPSVFAKVENAHGLLRDCFQQSIVAVANVFDPTFDGTRLFATFQTKLDQSVALRRDLWLLLQSVRATEQGRDHSHVTRLLEAVAQFRRGSLRYMMYKDWESFERLADELTTARGAAELGPVLHRFGAYLETLFGQINMRAVLSEKPFDYPTPDGQVAA